MEARCVKGHVDGNSVVVTLNDFLAFVTPSDFLPVIGFSTYPRIEFDYDLPANSNIRKKIHASTCTNRLNMPVYDALSTPDTLEEEIVFCILNAPDFGQI